MRPIAIVGWLSIIGALLDSGELSEPRQGKAVLPGVDGLLAHREELGGLLNG